MKLKNWNQLFSKTKSEINNSNKIGKLCYLTIYFYKIPSSISNITPIKHTQRRRSKKKKTLINLLTFPNLTITFTIYVIAVIIPFTINFTLTIIFQQAPKSLTPPPQPTLPLHVRQRPLNPIKKRVSFNLSGTFGTPKPSSRILHQQSLYQIPCLFRPFLIFSLRHVEEPHFLIRRSYVTQSALCDRNRRPTRALSTRTFQLGAEPHSGLGGPWPLLNFFFSH